MEQLLPFLIIAGKSTLVYLFIIAAIRLFGKKELAQLSVIDLVFILLISNSVQNAMVGADSSLGGGIAAALGLFTANYLLKALLHRFKGLDKVIQGEKITLIHDGQLLRKGLREAGMTKEELERAIREHGVSGIDAVDLAILEVDGNMSILSKGYTQKTVRQREETGLQKKSATETTY